MAITRPGLRICTHWATLVLKQAILALSYACINQPPRVEVCTSAWTCHNCEKKAPEAESSEPRGRREGPFPKRRPLSAARKARAGRHAVSPPPPPITRAVSPPPSPPRRHPCCPPSVLRRRVVLGSGAEPHLVPAEVALISMYRTFFLRRSGPENITSSFSYHYQRSGPAIFVIPSSSTERIPTARNYFRSNSSVLPIPLHTPGPDTHM